MATISKFNGVSASNVYYVNGVELYKTEEVKGVTTPWTPYKISNALAWFDADDDRTIDKTGTAVNSWTDKISGKVASQSNASYKPVTDVYQLNGQGNAIRFTQDELEVSMFTGTVQNVSVVMAYNPENEGTSMWLEDDGSDNWVYEAEGFFPPYEHTWSTGGDELVAINAYSRNVPQITAMVNDVTGNSKKTWRNGTEEASTTVGSSFGSTNGFRIGAIDGDYCNLQVGDMIVGQSVFSTADRQLAEAYLSSKWAI